MALDQPLSFQEHGRRPPIVILHGLFGSSRNWQRIAKALADHAHVFALDLRNHGESPWSDTMTYPEMADDVRRFIEERCAEPPAIVGHSMGGKTAITLAMTAPEVLDRLVIVDIAPARSNSDHLHLVQAMQAVDLDGLTRRAEVDAWLADEVPEAPTRSFLLQNLGPGPEGGLRWRLNLHAIAHNMAILRDFDEALTRQTFAKPTLLVEGEASDYVRPEHYLIYQHMFPRLQMSVIEGAGHDVHADRPDAFLNRVQDFLFA